MLAGRLISTPMPGASFDAAFTGFSGIVACRTPARGIFIPPIIISRGAGEEHSFSLQETASPNRVARRRERERSGSPLSIQARTRSVEPLGGGLSALIQTRLCSLARGGAAGGGGTGIAVIHPGTNAPGRAVGERHVGVDHNSVVIDGRGNGDGVRLGCGGRLVLRHA